MRIEQLEYIAAVTRFGSLRRAGEELHISQPALSETVRNLERELGVTLLDRLRSGARISADGRELLPHIKEVLEAVDRLRAAADDQHRSRRIIRIGTVNSASGSLLTPAIRAFVAALPGTQVEVMTSQQADIHRYLGDGSVDLGLVSLLPGEASPDELVTTELLAGRPMVCCHPTSDLARLPAVPLDLLRTEPIIAMRAGNVMYRYLQRVYHGEPPPFAYSTDGAEVAKLLVAHGLGVTVLPEYSVAGDPLEMTGAIAYRPLAVEGGAIQLVAQHRRLRYLPETLRMMHRILTTQAAGMRRLVPAARPTPPHGNGAAPDASGRPG